MTDLEPRALEIVGVPRSHDVHYARACSDSQRVVILHSQDCLDHQPDLRKCIYSVALDQGIDPKMWRRYEDRPVEVIVFFGELIPLRVVP